MQLDLHEAVLYNRLKVQEPGSQVRAGSDFERRLAQLVAAWQAANDFPVVDGKWTDEVSETLDQTFLVR
jgi:hypothetical protein